MKYLILLLLFAGVAVCAITSQKYGMMDMQVGKDLNFKAALFEVEFDGVLNLTGQGLVQDLSLEVPPSTSGEGADMPIAIMAQMGVAQLVCPCDECDLPAYPECDAVQCLYESVPGMNGNDGAPRFLLPMPAVEGPAEVLFQTFAGGAKNATPRANVFIAIKIIESFEGDQAGWRRYMPETLQISQCSIRFTDGTNSPSGSHLESGGVSLSGVQSGTFAPINYGCSSEDLGNTIAGIQGAVASLGTQQSKEDLQSAQWDIAAFKASTPWLGCMEVAKQLVTVGKAERTIPGDRRCTEMWGTDAWNADPCCSPEAAQAQCCAARPIVVEVDTVTGIDIDGITTRCSDPQLAIQIVEKLVDNIEDASQCKIKAQSSGANPDMWGRLTKFVMTCQSEIYGDQSGRPTCEKDDDCWTRCDTQMGECIVPFDGEGAAGPLRECMVANMNEELFIHLGRLYGFSRGAPTSVVEAAFRANLESITCMGPTGWEFGDKWESEVVDNCTGINDCWCWDDPGVPASRVPGSTCMRNYMVPANLTACVQDTVCNWNQMITNGSQCASGPTSDFCGECYGPQCWERSRPSRCSTWVMTNTQCLQLGGVQGQYEGDCVFPNRNTEDLCLPKNYCLDVNNNDFLGMNKGCGGACVVDGVNASQCAALVPGVNGAPSYIYAFMWQTGTVSGSGYCEAQGAWGPDMCKTIGNGTGLTYIPWMNFEKGRFDTNETCTAGYCTIDERLTPEQCESQASCTERCSRCRSNDWGYTACVMANATSQTGCDNVGGSWRVESSVCVLEGTKTQSACAQIGGTFMNCESLTPAQCSACGGSGSCPINQGLMQCYVNKWDDCETEEECVAAGMCEDWQLENYKNPQCFNYPLIEACAGVCIVDYDYSQGNPSCDWNNGQEDSPSGCIDTNILGEANCTASGGTFVRRAASESECDAHGSRCYEERFYGFTSKSQEQCESCDGEMKEMYRWRGGRWIGGEVKPLEWKQRMMESVNIVGSALNWTLLSDVINDVGASMVGKAMQTEVNCEMSSIGASMQALACLCGTSVGTCDVSDVLWADMGSIEFFAGIDKTIEVASSKVFIDGSAINGTDSIQMSIREVADIKAKLIAEGTDVGETNARSFTDNPLEVVTNGINTTIPVGQIVGTCVNITLGAPSVYLCIVVTEEFHNATYPIPDFATSPSNGTYIVGNFSDAVATGSAICATIIQDGIYCPIRRIDDYLNPVSIPVVGTTTGTSSSSSSSSTSHAGRILLIVFGSIFLFSILVLFLGIIVTTAVAAARSRSRRVNLPR